MKRYSVVVCCLVLALALGLSASAQDKMKGMAEKKSPAKTMSVNGEVVDVSCYLAHGEKGTGADHQGCAEACAKAGSPLGILTKEGKLYVSLMPDDHAAGPSAKLMDHIGKQVEVTGALRSKGGVNGIMISEVKAAGEQPAGEKK
jgi:hypothetical protein